MVFDILDSASFEDAMQDLLDKADEQGVNTDRDQVSVFIKMNGRYSPNGAARVNSRIFVNEADSTIASDIFIN